MLLSKTGMIKWNGANRKYYELKGYIFTKSGDEFEVKVEELKYNSKALVNIKCDYCNEIYETTYQKYNNNRDRCIVKKDACKKHKYEKLKEANMIKYGVENVKQLESSKEKARQTQLEKYGATNVMKLDKYKDKLKDTMIEKYGVENSMYVDEFKEKIKETNLERYGTECSMNNEEIRSKIIQNNIEIYGVEYYNQTEECKEKVKQTNLDKFGSEWYMQTNEWKNKVVETCNKKYGVDNISQLQDVKIKKAESFYKNATVCTSNQQRYLWSLLGGELNYSNDTPSLDIAFSNEKIYLEFNGSGHDLDVKMGTMTQLQHDNRERARYYYMKKRGWKGIFINSPRDYLPSDEILIKEINKAKEWFKVEGKNHSHYNIDIGMFINDDKYGKLRRIKEKDLKVAN